MVTARPVGSQDRIITPPASNSTQCGVSPNMKFSPRMTIDSSSRPDAGSTESMRGAGTTWKGMGVLADPPTVTTRGPVVAPGGTDTLISVLLQDSDCAGMPLKVTVLVCCVSPKYCPVSEIIVPM